MDNKVKNYLAQIGKKGGKVCSAAKAGAARKNGTMGGRPRIFAQITAYQAMREIINGEDWKIAFMNFVDSFRKRPSYTLVQEDMKDLRPDPKMYALLQSICIQLCLENKLSAKGWLTKRSFLSRPWFVSGIKNLYATALKESPVAFRKNNIFVLENFMSRV